MPQDVFISYATEDKEAADAVCGFLEDRGIGCWIAPRDMPPGALYGAPIVEAIDQSRVMVLVFSAASNDSQYVILEVERAVNRRVTIIPLRLQNVPPSKDMEFFISAPQWLDASQGPLEQHLERLAQRIAAILQKPLEEPKEPEAEVVAETATKEAGATEATEAGPARAVEREEKPSHVERPPGWDVIEEAPTRWGPGRTMAAVAALLVVAAVVAVVWMGTRRPSPERAEIEVMIGQRELAQGRVDKAIKTFTKAIRLNPTDSRIWWQRGNAYFERKLYDHAIADYSQAIELSPDFQEAIFNRGVCYNNTRMWDEAISDYTKAIELAPNDPKSYEGRAQTWCNKREYDKAWNDVNKCKALGGSPDSEFIGELKQLSGRNG